MSNEDAFDKWLARADRICARRAGVDLDSLGDGPSYSAWDDGLSPGEYVAERLAEAGFPEESLAPATPGTVPVPRPVRYGDGSPEAAIASEDVRRANWSPSRQYRAGRYVDSVYVPKNEAVDAALKIRKAGRPMPRLY